MPIYSGGGGGSFNGGTITQALTVDAGGAGEALVDADATGGTVAVDGGSGTGGARLTGDNSGGTLDITGPDLGTSWLVEITAAATSDRVNVTNNDTGDTPLTIDPNGYLFLATHSAPADAAHAAGECALWFDQTNGAAKLMLKGKTANGTVVTASVALA